MSYLNNQDLQKPLEIIYLLPGMVYRRDVLDKTHVGKPHQYLERTLLDSECNEIAKSIYQLIH